jgi:hypothetical protein
MAVDAMAYPDVLTKKAWDKNKGLLAKIAVGKTDVGKCLSELEDAFDKAGFSTVKAFGGTDPIAFKAYADGLLKGLSSGFGAIAAKIKAATAAVSDAIDEFEKSKTVPKSTVVYTKSIKTALESFAKDLTKYHSALEKELTDDYRDKLKKSRGYLALQSASSSSGKTINGVFAKIKKVLVAQTVDAIVDEFSSDGPHRTLTTDFKLWDQLVRPDFPDLCKKVYDGKAMSDFFTLPGLSEVANEANGEASKPLRAEVKKGKPEDKLVINFMQTYYQSVRKAEAMMDHINDAWKIVSEV